MSQTLESKETSPAADVWSPDSAPKAEPALSSQEYQEFDYRPMPVLAPVAGVFGVVSLLSYLGLFGIALALLGIPVSLMAVWVILRSQGVLSGLWLAMIGLLLCTANTTGGIALQVYLYQHEVPEGYERVSFTSQISKPGFVTENGQETIPHSVHELFGKPIFLKGFMYPQERTEDLSHFLLLKDSGQCCFGGKPALQDMIGIVIEEDMEVDYYAGRVAVAGTFVLNEHYEGGSLDPVYLLKLEHFSKAQTSF